MSLRSKELDQLFERELGPTHEESLLEMTTQLSRGRALHVTILVMVLVFAFMGLMVYSAIRFFDSTEVRDLILWAVLFLYGSLAVAMLKLWTWMDMQKNTVVREVKRLELQIARMRAERSMGTGASEADEGV